MGNVVAKLVIFSILLNLAGGLVMVGVVDIKGDKIFDRSVSNGFVGENGEEYSEDYISELEKSIKPSGDLDDAGDQIYRVLDTLSLGFIYRFIDVVDTYMYGFINMLDNIIGDMLNDDVRAILFGNTVKFGAFKIMVTISYILMGIFLFTGKDVVEGS